MRSRDGPDPDALSKPFASKKIRLEVSSQDAAILEWMQRKCRGLYNWWVMRLRDGEKWPGWQEAKKTLQESREHDPELKWVYGKLLHEVYFRLDGAMKAFFRRVKNGEKPGFPRVRHGKEMVIVDERDTSKTCSGCGHKQAMPLWKRTYRCPNPACRLVLDRDENSAVNILKRSLARLGPHGRFRAVCGRFHRNRQCEHI
ncbi:MAG TPA: zinc ribbon domain-containing protein [Ktedonobacteraceae bacterium]|nr:zinc ribbon domain-containing protein [Ktedonobacteraceae bacterium]